MEICTTSLGALSYNSGVGRESTSTDRHNLAKRNFRLLRSFFLGHPDVMDNLLRCVGSAFQVRSTAMSVSQRFLCIMLLYVCNALPCSPIKGSECCGSRRQACIRKHNQFSCLQKFEHLGRNAAQRDPVFRADARDVSC